MPGVANIEMTIEGTAMKVNQKINVGIQKPKLSQVTASIESESQVLENTFVELYSNKKDSRIYYVVNGPIDSPNLQVYTGSIIIKNDTFLTAIAYHDDYEKSEPSDFTYSVIHIYTITFDANGGISDIISKEVRSTEKYGDLPIPTREFYIFEGWYKELSFTNEITNNTLVLITKKTTLYAKWNPVSFTISFQSNGGTPVDPITQQQGNSAA